MVAQHGDSAQETQDADPILEQYWASVENDGTILTQHLVIGAEASLMYMIYLLFVKPEVLWHSHTIVY